MLHWRERESHFKTSITFNESNKALHPLRKGKKKKLNYTLYELNTELESMGWLIQMVIYNIGVAKNFFIAWYFLALAN